MALGEQMIAPKGCGTLKRDCAYHFLLRDEERNRVLLIGLAGKKVWLEYMECKNYDNARSRKLITSVPRDEMKRMPPWLQEYESRHISDVIASQQARKRSKLRDKEHDSQICDRSLLEAQAIIDNRISKIRKVLESYEDILSCEQPEKKLNRLARECTPAVKEKRFRNWALTALAFPCNPSVLLPPPSGRGKYIREPENCRHGRPRLDGSASGFDVTEEMKLLMIKGFHKFAEEGVILSDIYTLTLEHTFECIARIGSCGFELCQPYGKPYPSYGQFRYWCYKLIGEDKVKRALLGEIEYHNKFEAPKGSYSEGGQDAFQVGHMDVSYTKVHPISPLSGLTLPKLTIAKVVCRTTGMIMGMAAGFGKETKSLYLQALFVCALTKSKFGEYMGVKIKDEDWQVDVLPLRTHTDQGPGASPDIQKIQEHLGMSNSMSPAYSPQTNSVVEGKHDKEPKLAGAPKHKRANASPIKLFRKEILGAIKKNMSANASRRVTPSQLARGIKSPHQLCTDLRNCGRESGLAMPIEELVTICLPKITAMVKSGFVTFKGIRYRSDELSKTTFAKKIRQHEGAEITGYCLEISTRVLWIMVEGKVIEVNAVDQIIAGKDTNAMTLFEHVQHGQNMSVAESDMKHQRAAGQVWKSQQTAQANGTPLKATSVNGRAKVRTRKVKAETAAMGI